MSKTKRILFITEGKKPEKNLVKSVCNFQSDFFSHKIDYEIVIFSTNIYSLYEKLKENQYEQTVEHICELSDGEFEYTSEDFSLIYLFFDLDAQHYKEYKDLEKIYIEIEEMLNLFDNATENGKLFLSYPMVEASNYFHESFINHDSVNLVTYPVFSDVRFKDACESFIKEYGPFQTRMKDKNQVWFSLTCYTVYILFHLKINSFIQEGLIDSKDIFLKQYNDFILRLERVLLLSAFPQYLLDFYGVKRFINNELLQTLLNNELAMEITHIG
ncbi:hypothetical protein QM453_08720 [Streptococcus mitis]|mgnify:CR=1 FL=1|jgi:hypothetical protein|uniref:hypothetical protein n=1 Tax=Streptococcus mitis TaxID=28037 RepID=UPI0039C3B529